MIDRVPMKLVPGEKIIPFEIGQEIMVCFEDMNEKVAMEVVKIYSNGDFDGEVEWWEA